MRFLFAATLSLLIGAGSALASEEGLFDVTGIAPGEKLIVKRWPDPKSHKTGELSHDAKWVKKEFCNSVNAAGKVILDTDPASRGLPRFCYVTYGEDEQGGWVDPRFLTASTTPPPKQKSTDISGYPADVVAAFKGNLESCEVFKLQKGFATNQHDLNGDGTKDWIIDYGELVCDGMHTMFSGSGGSMTQVLISTGPGKWTERFNEYVREYKVVTRKGKTVLSLGLHGSACKKSGAAPCSRTVDFNNR